VIHYEYCPDEEKIIAYDVEEIKCRRIGGAREIHWTTPEALCHDPTAVHRKTHVRLAAEAEEAKAKLSRFINQPMTIQTRTAK